MDKRSEWIRIRSLVLVIAFFSAVCAGICWKLGELGFASGVEVDLLLWLLLILNCLPAIAEGFCGRLDLLDAKHLFLVYFFLIFVVSSVAEIKFGFVREGIAVPQLDAQTRIRALSAIVLGLATFIFGCYLPIGKRLASSLPSFPRFSSVRLKLVATCGILSGLVGFYVLMASAGGIAGFLEDLGSWRTMGVLAGVGYLTFPIGTILPASVLLLLVGALQRIPAKLSRSAMFVLLLAALSLYPVLILGFRVTLVPIICQILIVWHYLRRQIPLGRIVPVGAVLIIGLACYSNVRSNAAIYASTGFEEAFLFRTAGLATVERVVQRMDQGEPHRGPAAGLIEAVTILVPRAIWPNKPETAGLAFDDIFFSDFYIGRGDPVDGIKSGISTTCIGEFLWIGGIAMVVVGLVGLGIAAKTMTDWRKNGRCQRLRVFIYALFAANLPIFVEAPQNGLNSFVMIGALCFVMASAISVRPLDAGGRRSYDHCCMGR